LVVSDSRGGSANDYVYITVTNTNQNNGNPIVDAGTDKTIAIGGSIRLAPTVSDPDGDPLTYSWNCSEGSLSSTNILNPTFTSYSNTNGTVAVCTLNVYDNKNGNSSDSVNIYIGTQNSSNSNPIVDAGPDKYIQVGGSVKLTPTVSDPNGDVLTYNWNCNGGRLSSSNILSPTFTMSSSTYNSYYCTLSVSDGKGGSASDSVTISTEQQNSSNPVITVGSNREVIEGNTISLGVSAYDPNGYSLTYNWTCTGGVLSSYHILNPSYTAPMVNSDTNYYCTITATNNRGGSSSANVNILVRDTNSNQSGLTVTTSQATGITTTTATLNGRVSSGTSVNASFEWGRINGSMSNNTNQSNGKDSGESFSANLNDLEKGKAYQFKAKGQNNSGTAYGAVQKFITKPDAPINFNATVSGTTRVNLTWTKGEGAYYTTITRKIGSYPQTATDGSVVYYGTGTSFTDSVSSGQYYYYRAWSVAYDGGMYAWSDSDYARDYVVTGSAVTYNPIVQVVSKTAPKKVVKTVVEEVEEEECVIVKEIPMKLEVTGRNITQKKEWSRNVNANPGDEIDVEIELTSTSDETIDNIMLTNTLPTKVSEVYNITIDGEQVGMNMDNGIMLGRFKPGETRIMTFTIKISDANEFKFGESVLTDTVEVSGKDFEPTQDKLSIRVGGSNTFGFAGISSLFGDNWFWAFLLFGLLLFILLLIIVLVYVIMLLMKKDKQEKERLERDNYAAQRSKYFQIQ
jgi:hypothetical protein